MDPVAATTFPIPGLLLAGSAAAAVGGLWRRRQKMLGM